MRAHLEPSPSAPDLPLSTSLPSPLAGWQGAYEAWTPADHAEADVLHRFARIASDYSARQRPRLVKVTRGEGVRDAA